MSTLTRPAQRLQVTLTEDVAASRFVTFGGALPAAAGDRCAGPTYVKADSGDRVAVTVLGTATAISANATAIAVGDELMADTDGKLLARTGALAHVATALEAVTAADTEFEVFITPN